MRKNIGISISFLSLAIGIQTLYPIDALAKPSHTKILKTPFNPDDIELVWKLDEYAIEGNNHYTKASFIIKNNGKTPINTNDWTLYFTSISGVRNSNNLNNRIVEPVSPASTGSLFKIKIATNNEIIAPGKSFVFHIEHLEPMVKMEKAPQGPYIVFDNNLDRGYAIKNYKLEQIPRGSNFANAPKDFKTIVTPTEIYEKNQIIKDIPKEKLSPIFPNPQYVKTNSGVLKISAAPKIIAPTNLKNEVLFAKNLFKNLPKSNKNSPTIKLEINNIKSQISPEAYELKVDENGIKIIGNSAAGIYYGLQSLSQLMPIDDKDLSLPFIEVNDAPRFEYRGLLVDVARNFQDKNRIKKTIDIMARLKLNKMHLHLVDDEGWRIEIKQIPELTQYGAKRGHQYNQDKSLPPAYGSGPDVNDRHGSGYFTQADFIEILQYAAKNHIDIIPEIEMPGHSRAAVKSMESLNRKLIAAGDKNPDKYLLSDPDDKSQYHTAQNYTDDVMNPALPSTYKFIETVTSEIAQMYKKAGVKQTMLQVGGDELANGAWEKSPLAIKKMNELGMSSTNQLWDYFYDNVDNILKKNGFKIGAWEELGVKREKDYPINPKFLNRDATLFVWNNLEGSEDLAYRLANNGYKVVLGPVTNFYLDMAHSEDVLEGGHNWANYTDLDNSFSFNPYAMKGTQNPTKVQLNNEAKKNIMGVEAMMFSETMRDPKFIDYMMLPRLYALSYRGWNIPKDDNQDEWSNFVNQLGKIILPKLSAQMPDINYRISPPGLKIENGQILVNYQLPGFDLRYSVGNEMPNPKSPIVNGPIKDKGVVNVAAFDKNGRQGHISTIENR